MRDGSIVTADEYVSAVPVDIMKRLLPKPWAKMPFFRQFDELEGIPVINLVRLPPSRLLRLRRHPP